MSWQELLIGPTFGGSIGGVCPDNSYLWHNSETNISNCCCSDGWGLIDGCCWAACSTTVVGQYPPNNCLPEGAHWKKRRGLKGIEDWHAVKGRFRFEGPKKDSMLLLCLHLQMLSVQQQRKQHWQQWRTRNPQSPTGSTNTAFINLRYWVHKNHSETICNKL